MLKNNEMESKILLYENKQNKNLLLSEQINNNNTNNIFNQSLKKFIKNLKISLKNNIESNKNLNDKLMKELFQFQKQNENNMKQKNIYDNLKIKLQTKKEKISDIQKYNKENNKRYLYLKDKKDLMNKTVEKLKLNFSNLKSREKNLILKKDTNIKNNSNNKDIIFALQKTINNLRSQKKNQMKNKIIFQEIQK